MASVAGKQNDPIWEFKGGICLCSETKKISWINKLMMCFYITEKQKRDIKVAVVFQQCGFEERQRNCVN